jgi:hypothetical protein
MASALPPSFRSAPRATNHARDSGVARALVPAGPRLISALARFEREPRAPYPLRSPVQWRGTYSPA